MAYKTGQVIDKNLLDDEEDEFSKDSVSMKNFVKSLTEFLVKSKFLTFSGVKLQHVRIENFQKCGISEL